LNLTDLLGDRSQQEREALIERQKEITPDDIAYLPYISKTMGQPKGVMISHYQYIRLNLGFIKGIGGFTDEDRLIVAALFSLEYHIPYGNENEIKRLAPFGQPAIDVDVKIMHEQDNELVPNEVGKIAARRAWIMKGYWNKPERTEETFKQGWVYTGDMGYVDGNGFLCIVDRKKDMIVSGGENVYPREIEEYCIPIPRCEGRQSSVC